MGPSYKRIRAKCDHLTFVLISECHLLECIVWMLEFMNWDRAQWNKLSETEFVSSLVANSNWQSLEYIHVHGDRCWNWQSQRYSDESVVLHPFQSSFSAKSIPIVCSDLRQLSNVKCPSSNWKLKLFFRISSCDSQQRRHSKFTNCESNLWSTP